TVGRILRLRILLLVRDDRRLRHNGRRVEVRLRRALTTRFIDRPLAAALRRVDQRLAIGRELEVRLALGCVRDALGTAAVRAGDEYVTAEEKRDFFPTR